MQHIFQKGTDPSKPTLVLLHGTGGTEHDLLPVAQIVSPESSVLSIRGNVLEHGMPRFFRRLSEGVFDEEDLIFRTNELNEFLNEAASKYELDRNNFIAVGYSNGANIAGSLLFHHQGSLRGAVLHHPMVPRRGLKLPDLTGTPVFIGAGTNDPICAPQETEELQTLLNQAGAHVTVHWEQDGHQLTHSEVHAASSWLQSHINQG
ncbi:phospholipase/carboxylesterase [Paenibacillus alvei TS-15]|uniref:Phospholipase/carboxylesterase n=1 Tax=Paenibacillus alvei TS-15 TaxID=1117108 RepID=S9SNY9_PAEAL|nr:alpha/beta hydrolase [Paenibacillus alvei]EPY05798.1 phospholipase/carboxylesterase [Paenibacillus alvei TS-15]